ncbi:hypothetical protein YC2023_119317 [Brassica napus]
MKLMSFRSLLVSSMLLRVFLIIYGEWQDAHMEVRYTVFSDAASLMASGESSLQENHLPLLTRFFSSPIQSSILLGESSSSLLLVCNLSQAFFKGSTFSLSRSESVCLCPSDLLVGLFIREILKLRKVPEKVCTVSVMVWLLNPFTFTIGTRGNCEPLVCAMLLWIIISLMKGTTTTHTHTYIYIYIYTLLFSQSFTLRLRIVVTCGTTATRNLSQAAFWYGLVRVYPIIYALPIILVLDSKLFSSGHKPPLQDWNTHTSSSREKKTFHLKNLFSRERIMFCLFLHEALLYHLTRTDPRHNFSIYFYHIYLHYERQFSAVEKLISFLPQFTVQLALVFCFSQDLVFCMFLQTVAFVAFNKVITAQYFVWFYCLLPLILPWSRMKLKWEGILCIILWIGAQTHWLLWGYMLEFKGVNVFLQLWMASLVFLAANTFVLVKIIQRHRFSPLFGQYVSSDRKNVKKLD